MSETTDLQTFLAELEAEHERTGHLISEIRRRMGASANGEKSNVPGSVSPNATSGRDAVQGRIRPDEFFRLTVREAIRKYLEIMRAPQGPRAIVEGLKAGGVLTNAKHFYANVWTELKRMRARELVVNTPSGWGLAEWYPNKPRQIEAPKPKRGKRKAQAKGVKALPGPSAAPFRARPKGHTWQEFVALHAPEGKTLQQIAAEWKVLKGGEA